MRYVYGARCEWHGSISEVGSSKDHLIPGRDSGLSIPCCPRCGGPLFEVPTAQHFITGVMEHDKTHPGYAKFLQWVKTRKFCRGSLRAAAYDYMMITGNRVELGGYDEHSK